VTAILLVLALLIVVPLGLAYLLLQAVNFLLCCMVEFLVYLGD
jgi:hypothetical protein